MGVDQGVVSFEPLHSLSAHFVMHCSQPSPMTRPDRVAKVWGYTSSWYCTEINLCLAADDAAAIAKNGQFIADLNEAIHSLGERFSGTLYRGHQLSDHELQVIDWSGIILLPIIHFN